MRAASDLGNHAAVAGVNIDLTADNRGPDGLAGDHDGGCG